MMKYIIIALVVMGLIGGWLTDVGEVISGSDYPVATNGFWSMPASQVYHIGMYLAAAANIILGMIAFHYREKYFFQIKPKHL